MPELVQPVMVVVLMVIARAAGAARVAGLFFSGNGRATNMGNIVEDAAPGAASCG